MGDALLPYLSHVSSISVRSGRDLQLGRVLATFDGHLFSLVLEDSYIRILIGKVCLRHHDQLNTGTVIFKKDIFRKRMFWH